MATVKEHNDEAESKQDEAENKDKAGGGAQVDGPAKGSELVHKTRLLLVILSREQRSSLEGGMEGWLRTIAIGVTSHRITGSIKHHGVHFKSEPSPTPLPLLMLLPLPHESKSLPTQAKTVARPAAMPAAATTMQGRAEHTACGGAF